jgi:hypothetical protein
MDTATEYVSVAEAARRLGTSRSAVHRRLAAGQLDGRREPRPQGTVWLVAVPEEAPTRPETSRQVRHVPRRPGPTATRPDQELPGDPPLPNLAQRAEDMAVYSHRLLEPYVATIASQAERLGRLELELEQSRARVTELEATRPAETNGQAETQNAAPEWPERRRWWQRLVWG